MGSWNHRVFREVQVSNDKKYKQTSFTIREVHYKGKSCKKGKECSCKPQAFTVEPIAPAGETIEELRSELEMMLKALDKPVLTRRSFK